MNIEKTLCPESDRLKFLPSKVGDYCGVFESIYFNFFGLFFPSYSGGFFDFYSLDNGGFYLSLSDDVNLEYKSQGNYYEGSFSAESASIIVMMATFSHMAFTVQNENAKQMFSDQWHLLREYVFTIDDGKEILKAID